MRGQRGHRQNPRAGADDAAGALCFMFCGFAFIGMGFAMMFGFCSIMPTDMALAYNSIYQTVDPVPHVDAGIGWVGPWTQMIRYPKTIQTIEFSGAYGANALLDARTSDGLPLVLGVTFQYRLQPENLYRLYRAYDHSHNAYERVFRLLATHLITGHATNFTAYEFFNDKMRIAENMRQAMDAYFTANLFATVESLQINEDDLPTAFTDAVLLAATEKQNITRMQKLVDSQTVNFGTARIVAYAQANVTVNAAIGQQHRITQNGRADASIIDAYVSAEKVAYKLVKDAMQLEGESLVNYIWYDSLSGGGVTSNGDVVDTSMLVGVSPAAYISGSGSPAAQ